MASNRESNEKIAWGLLAICLAPAAVFAQGLAFSVLWRWFVVPTFHVAEIGVANAFGLALLCRLATHQWSDCAKRDTSEDLPSQNFFDGLGQVLAPLFGLAIGYVVSRFM